MSAATGVLAAQAEAEAEAPARLSHELAMSIVQGRIMVALVQDARGKGEKKEKKKNGVDSRSEEVVVNCFFNSYLCNYGIAFSTNIYAQLCVAPTVTDRSCC